MNHKRQGVQYSSTLRPVFTNREWARDGKGRTAVAAILYHRRQSWKKFFKRIAFFSKEMGLFISVSFASHKCLSSSSLSLCLSLKPAKYCQGNWKIHTKYYATQYELSLLIKQVLCGTREVAMDRYFIGSLDKWALYSIQ